MQILQTIFEAIIHLDSQLLAFVAKHGVWTYFLVFLVIFCETGLVIIPFLPGDSLLFALGSVAAQSSQPLNILLLLVLLSAAAIIGNQVNYILGRYFGVRLFSRWINPRHLQQAHDFYERYGAVTLVFARFTPILRTFAPFVAGISNMGLGRYTLYNFISGALWVVSLLLLGYFFGSLPVVATHFSRVDYSVFLLGFKKKYSA